MQLAREELEQAYRQMKTIREFEDHLHREIAKGTIGGFTHLYGGQEAIAVGVCENLILIILHQPTEVMVIALQKDVMLTE